MLHIVFLEQLVQAFLGWHLALEIPGHGHDLQVGSAMLESIRVELRCLPAFNREIIVAMRSNRLQNGLAIDALLQHLVLLAQSFIL